MKKYLYTHLHVYIHDRQVDIERLKGETIERLQTLVPTLDEEKRIQNLKSSNDVKLGVADDFLMRLTIIPHVKERLTAIAFLISFEEKHLHVKKAMLIVKAACEDIRSSQHLKKVSLLH